METMEMTMGSLFDGSGGFPLAASINGITPLWASEVEPYPIKVTKARFPKMKHLGNIKNIRGGIDPVDIICGGSPCQNLSIAGNRTGLDGQQSSLFFEYIRVVKEMREATNGEKPKYMVWENVPGAFSSNKGRDFGAVLENIAKIKDPQAAIPVPEKWERAGNVVGNGYSIAWRVLDAQFWGVPQRRQRIFLIASFDDERAGEILFDSEGMFGDSSANFRAWKKTTETDGRSADETGKNNVPLSLKVRQGCAGGGKGALITKDKTGTLGTVNDITLFYPVYEASIQNHFTAASENVASSLVAIDGKEAPVVSFPVLNDQMGSSITVGDDLSPALRTGSQHEPCVLDKTTYDVTEDTTTYIVRRITPTECARLQGFPDWWCDGTEIEDPTGGEMEFWRGVFDEWCEINGKKRKTDNQIRKWLKTENSDSAKYKMWGNGVALPCVDYVMCSIARKENK